MKLVKAWHQLPYMLPQPPTAINRVTLHTMHLDQLHEI